MFPGYTQLTTLVIFNVCWGSQGSAQSVNIAQGKPGEMSAVHLDHGPALAVDGDLSTIMYNPQNEPSSWYKLDLQTFVEDANVVTYYITNYKWARNGIELYTSLTPFSTTPGGQLCHRVTGMANGNDIPDVLSVTCPGRWRYLMAYTDTDNDGSGPRLAYQDIQVNVAPTCDYASRPAIQNGCETLTFGIAQNGGSLSAGSSMLLAGLDKHGCGVECLEQPGCQFFSFSSTGDCRLSSQCYPTLEDDPQSVVFYLTNWSGNTP